jgi:hypothetical protein
VTDDGDAAAGIARTFAQMATVRPEVVLGIFARYGRPLAVTMPAAAPDDQRHLLIGPDGAETVVRLLRVLGFGDVIPNDYFVLEPSAGEPLAVPGPLFSAALAALARAAGATPA